MIALATIAAAILGACQIDKASRPTLPAEARTIAPFDTDSIRLSHVCGTRFRIRNENDFAAQVQWDVVGSSNAGNLTLPGRPAGVPYSEVYLDVNAVGLARLSFQGQVIESGLSVGTPCVVPAVPPTTVPAALMTSLGEITMPNGRRARPDLTMVVFREGTPQQVRQAAVDAVSGLVVGGYPLPYGESAYYVLIPGQRSPEALLTALETLRGFPAIAQTGIIYIDIQGGAAYRKPNDGVGFRKADWSIYRSGATGRNWALEEINAPLAWGCETGSTAVRIGVVDQGYTTGTEVDANVVSGAILPTGIGRRHGLRVASVLGAPGNNATGLSGIMWQVAIDFRDRLADPNNLLEPMQRPPGQDVSDIVLTQHLVAAGDAGAQIINLSLSNEWDAAPDTSGSTLTSRNNRDDIRSAADAVRQAITTLRGRQRFPLFVISAGNDGLDARYSGYNHARTAYPDQIMIVGGSKQGGFYNNNPLGPSNYGSLVDIYAPGHDVAVMLPNQTDTLAGGTSFAAPLVAGTAGLLRSFDPRAHMTAAEMRRLILVGTTGGLTEPSPSGAIKPILNTYGALRKAAERTGAPLCGSQRVYAHFTTGEIRVERVRDMPSSDERLGTVDPMTMHTIFARHGGKSVQLGPYPGDGSLVWTPTGWTNGTPGPYDGGVVSQWWGGSHDRDSSIVFVYDTVTSQVELRLWKPGDEHEALVAKPYPFRISGVCSGICVGAGSHFISPAKPQAFVAYGIWRQVGATESVIEVYDLATRPESTTVLKSYPGKLIFNITQSEDGSELRVRLWVPPGNLCEYEFISLVPPDSGQVRRTISGWAPPPLGGVLCRDDATSSPRYAPRGGLTTSRTFSTSIQPSGAGWMVPRSGH